MDFCVKSDVNRVTVNDRPTMGEAGAPGGRAILAYTRANFMGSVQRKEINQSRRRAKIFYEGSPYSPILAIDRAIEVVKWPGLGLSLNLVRFGLRHHCDVIPQWFTGTTCSL